MARIFDSGRRPPGPDLASAAILAIVVIGAIIVIWVN